MRKKKNTMRKTMEWNRTFSQGSMAQEPVRRQYWNQRRASLDSLCRGRGGGSWMLFCVCFMSYETREKAPPLMA